MVCKTNRIRLCHDKRYGKQTVSGYVMTNGMYNRQTDNRHSLMAKAQVAFGQVS
jgi:hypothetical protein